MLTRGAKQNCLEQSLAKQSCDDRRCRTGGESSPKPRAPKRCANRDFHSPASQESPRFAGIGRREGIVRVEAPSLWRLARLALSRPQRRASCACYAKQGSAGQSRAYVETCCAAFSSLSVPSLFREKGSLTNTRPCTHCPIQFARGLQV